jgi:hypothetical protein
MALPLYALGPWHPCYFSNESLRPTYFLLQLKKVGKKKPLEGNALHPTITSILF